MAQAMMRQQAGMHRASVAGRQVAFRRAATSVRGCRRQAVEVRAFFSFLAPKTPAAPKTDPRAEELVESLIDVCSRTDAGAKASPAVKEEIAELVEELSQYCINAPVRSPLLWGTYEVLYASKAEAVGGPLKKGAGPVVFPGQVARQILEPPGSLVNQVTFKPLGFLSGESRQFGSINPISGDTFELTIDSGELNTGFGVQQRSFDIRRTIQLLYLDERLRVAKFLPREAGEDGADEREGDEILFVFQRVPEAGQEEDEIAEEEEEEEPQAAAKPSGTGIVLPLFGTRKVESLATRAERQVRQQMQQTGEEEEEEEERPARRRPFLFGGKPAAKQQAEEQEAPAAPQQRTRGGTQPLRRSPQPPRRGTQSVSSRPSREDLATQRAAAETEKRRIEEERRTAAAEARERAEAEKRERAERMAAIKEQLASLGEALAEKAAAAKEAAAALRELQREQGPVLKEVASARAALEAAQAESAEAQGALAEANQLRGEAEAAFKQAQAELKKAEAAYKQRVREALPASLRK